MMIVSLSVIFSRGEAHTKWRCASKYRAFFSSLGQSLDCLNDLAFRRMSHNTLIQPRYIKLDLSRSVKGCN